MEDLFDLLVASELNSTVCFLCAGNLASSRRADEHVFPKWMQRRFNLYDQRLTLLNGTDIPYRALTIPCCAACNNERLAPMERSIKERLFAKEFRSDAQLERDVALWVAKMFFGILYKEAALCVDRREPAAGRIISADYIKRELRLMHAILQALRLDVTLDGVAGFPVTVAVVDVQPLPGFSPFDFRDDFQGHSVFLQLDDRAVIVCFDGGAQREAIAELLGRIGSNRLHPLQAKELAAATLYRSRLLRRVPLYSVHKINEKYRVSVVVFDTEAKSGTVRYVRFGEDLLVTVPQLPIEAFTSPMFDEWIPSDLRSACTTRVSVRVQLRSGPRSWTERGFDGFADCWQALVDDHGAGGALGRDEGVAAGR